MDRETERRRREIDRETERRRREIDRETERRRFVCLFGWFLNVLVNY